MKLQQIQPWGGITHITKKFQHFTRGVFKTEGCAI